MNDIKQALEILKTGEVVGVPTETVYGLAASIESPEGIKAIFSTKERPFFDPLIVHISSIDQAKKYVSNWNETCDALAKAFWPGPLTMILDKTSLVDDLITSGLETVGIRFPSHPVAQELIESLGHPVAAPSANKFKKVSPTTADHVKAEFPDLFVLEGGECEVGIESTIIRPESTRITIYRPGMLTSNDFKAALGEGIEIVYQESPVAPGHLKEHYRPNKPVILSLPGHPPKHGISKLVSWEVPSDAPLAARLLYSKLRELDQSDCDGIEIIIQKQMLESEDFKGILNRLLKAAYLKSEPIKSEY